MFDFFIIIVIILKKFIVLFFSFFFLFHIEKLNKKKSVKMPLNELHFLICEACF